MDADQLGFDDDFMASMLGDFLDESEGYLSRLNENLMVLEELVSAADDGIAPEVDTELLNVMFRDAHSLKGLSAMLQLGDINSLTHRIENVFDAARDNSLSVSRPVVDLMFEAFDRLTNMVESLKSPGAEKVEFETTVENIKQLLENSGADRQQATNDDVARALEEAVPVTDVAPESLGEEVAEVTSIDSQDSLPSELVPTEDADPLAGVTDESDIPDKYLSIFIDESEESFDSLSELLIGDEQASIDPVLTICHRIKGGAASIGLNRMAKLAHLMEDLLQERRENGDDLTTEIADALMSAVDAQREFIESLKNGSNQADTFSQAYQVLRQVAASALAAPEATENTAEALADDSEHVSAALTENELGDISSIMPTGVQTVAGCVKFEAGVPLIELKAQLVHERLEDVGELFECRPNPNQLAEGQSVERIVFGVATELPEEEILKRIDLEGIENIELHVLQTSTKEEAEEKDQPAQQPEQAEQPGSPNKASGETPATPDATSGKPTPAPAPAQAKQEPAANKPNKPAETLRVDIERLDHLMNLAGQLVINKARFGQVGEQLKSLASRKQSGQRLTDVSGVLQRILADVDEMSGSSSSSAALLQGIQSHVQQINRELDLVRNDVDQLSQARVLVNDLAEAVHQLERVSDGIQKSVMDTRMVPIGPLFGRFKRVIRDITRNNGKDIQLLIRGDKTELDKRMIDELGDPLIHMVRNSADHGIESPADRVQAGKPKQGTVTLDAFHRGNKIFVQVSDDGKGLDPEKLKQKAIEKGLITVQDAERLTSQQALQLIWEPGFTTAEKVTEVSGRGMGMDIVRSKIEQINGAVEIDSRLGEGTTITINLPLTMAILPSLLTVIEEDVFAIPMESVSEIVKVSAKDLSTVHGLEAARVRGRVISVVELGGVLNWHGRPFANSKVGREKTLVIIGTDGNELGLAVDNLLGEEDIVIKSLAENYRNVSGLAGASILGDGRVSLILDVPALIDMSKRSSQSLQHVSQTTSV